MRILQRFLNLIVRKQRVDGRSYCNRGPCSVTKAPEDKRRRNRNIERMNEYRKLNFIDPDFCKDNSTLYDKQFHMNLMNI
jgi:hypothetical protein